VYVTSTYVHRQSLLIGFSPALSVVSETQALNYTLYTGWGKITSVTFKVNNKKTIRDKNILFLDSETTTWEVLIHIVLKRISCKCWPLFAWCLRTERLGDCKTDRLTASMFSGVREVRGRPHIFSDTLPLSLKFSTHNRMDFRSGTRSRGGIW